MTADPASGELPEAAYAAALASVATLGPKRLRALLDRSLPRAAWAALRRGLDDDPGGRWRRAAETVQVAATWDVHCRAGIAVTVLGDPAYPPCLARDPEAPAVLFTAGDPSVLERHPRVAVVGTRTPTRYGLGVAAQLGAELAGAGVCVVSGLALGVDGATHEGASALFDRPERPAVPGTTPAVASPAVASPAPPVGVVAGGLDTPYPRSHARLWQRVAATGALLSETPAGVPVPRWRFPQRNRILAAVAHVVVVVECHQHGGSLHTVRAAVRRGRAVGAVPGSVRSPASAGTNDLLADGCFVVRDVTDVLVALELALARTVAVRPRVRRRRPAAAPVRTTPAPASGTGPPGQAEQPEGPAGPAGPERPAGSADGSDDHLLLAELGWEPAGMEDLLRRTGLTLARAAAALARLESAGKVRGAGGWWQRA